MKKLNDLNDGVQEEEDAADLTHLAKDPQGPAVSPVCLNQPQMFFLYTEPLSYNQVHQYEMLSSSVRAKSYTVVNVVLFFKGKDGI